MDKSKSAVEIYDKIAKKYADTFFGDTSYEMFVEDFLELLPKNGKILDVGCGPGSEVKFFIERNFLVEGVDLSEEMIKIAKQMVPKGIFKVMDFRKLEYPDKTFDGIFANYSLIHIPEKEVVPTLREFNRVLKPDGIIYIAVDEGEEENFYDEPLKKGEKIFLKFFKEEEIKKDLEESGFSLIKITRKIVKKEEALGSNKLFVLALKK